MFSMFVLHPTIAASTIWSAPTQLTADPASDADPSIAYDSSGRIWVFFTSDRSGSPQIWYLCSNDRGQTWSSPQLFHPAQTPSGAHYIGETCLFEDSQGRLWTAWGRWSGSSQEDIYFSVSSDMSATWSDSRLLVSYYDVDGQPCFVQVGNNIWLIFSSYGIAGNWNIYYIETSDGGQTWSSPQGIVVDQFRHDSCSVVKDSAGKVQVFYTTLTSPYDPSSTDIWRVETSDQGDSWSVPKQVTSFPSEEGHISAVEFDGALYVFYMNRYAQNIWYVVSNDAGSTWSTSPERADSDPYNDQYPYAVVAGGELWVTWSSDRSGNWDVWIAHAQTIIPSATATTWTKYPANPLNLESGQLSRPWVVNEGNMYKMWYTVLAPGETAEKICFADSSDGFNWATHGAVLTGGSWDVCVLKPVVLYDGTIYKMWYLGAVAVGSPIQKVGYATSSDGVTWTKHTTPVLIPGGNGGWDDFTISTMTVFFDGTHYMMWYSAEDYSAGTTRMGVATSTDGISWVKYSNNPVLEPIPNSWESGHVWAGPVILNGEHYEMWYTGQTRDYPGRIGLATSIDGFSWARYENNPVLENGPPGSWDSLTIVSSCITEKESNLLLWYYGSDGETVRIGLATVVMTLPAYAWYHPGHTHENTETILQRIDVDSETLGDQQVVCAAPGQTITISYTFQMWSSGGPGIIKQAWFAYSWASSWPPWDAYTPLYSGCSGGYYPGFTETGSFTIIVPTTPGKYDVWFCTEAHYSMNQAVQGLTGPPDMPPHAIIIVSTNEIGLEVPYQNQGYANWCGPTSLAMVLRYYGEEFHSWDYASDKHLKTSEGTTDLYWNLGSYIEEKFPALSVEGGRYLDSQKNQIFEDVKAQIINKYPVILAVGEPFPKRKQHAIVIVGFNESGIFVNDPSGLLFTDLVKSTQQPSSYCHAYVDWSAIEPFIVTLPFTSTLTVKGIPNPSRRFGTIYVQYDDDVVFSDPKKPTDNYELYLNQGLRWNHTWSGKSQLDPVVAKKCSSLTVYVCVSNCRNNKESFIASFTIMRPDGTAITLEDKRIDDLKAYGTSGLPSNWQIPNVGSLLVKGGPYHFEFSLSDSNGLQVDHFVSESFYWQSVH